jgi:hypothetical protein
LPTTDACRPSWRTPPGAGRDGFSIGCLNKLMECQRRLASEWPEDEMSTSKWPSQTDADRIGRTEQRIRYKTDYKGILERKSTMQRSLKVAINSRATSRMFQFRRLPVIPALNYWLVSRVVDKLSICTNVCLCALHVSLCGSEYRVSLPGSNGTPVIFKLHGAGRFCSVTRYIWYNTSRFRVSTFQTQQR